MIGHSLGRMESCRKKFKPCMYGCGKPHFISRCVCVVAVHSHVLLEDYVPALRAHFGSCRVILYVLLF